MWGQRRFETSDDSQATAGGSRVLTFGEGWHNNHHAHPISARHGLAWYEFDITWIQIRLLQLLSAWPTASALVTVDGQAARRGPHGSLDIARQSTPHSAA